MKNSTFSTTAFWVSALTITASVAVAQNMAPVPGYIAPVAVATAPNYADDTRGVYVPEHAQHRLRTGHELAHAADPYGHTFQLADAGGYLGPNAPLSDAFTNADTFERELNRISGDAPAAFPAPSSAPAPVIQQQPMMMPQQSHTGHTGGTFIPSHNMQAIPAASAPTFRPAAPMAQPSGMVPAQTMAAPVAASGTGGVEVARSQIKRQALDMNNGVVRLREDRISIRRALQRMMDQIGGGNWTIVWDMAEQNAALPEMEISVYAEEPFINVMNALLARIQTRSGQPLRVIRYDNTQRLVITDRAGGHRLAGKTSPVGVGDVEEVAVTETVLKENMVSLHYDEIPLVDALENIVNQAGKGEWRLRVYAGLDQVLKPAHIEEPFEIAMERVLKLFNLKYEIFPGGKLIVVTHNNRFGYNSVQ